MAKSNLTAERLRELLDYNELSGLFTYRAARGTMQQGSIAGSKGFGRNGYVAIKIDGRLHAGHRLAWLYAFGEWPAGHLDHINRDRQDNRIANLRPATRKQNMENRTVRKDSTSGVKGVTPLPTGFWRATIKHHLKQIHLGCFLTIEDAHQARIKAEQKYFTHGVKP